MMSADFDAFEGNNNNQAAAADAKSDDNPLGVFDSTPATDHGGGVDMFGGMGGTVGDGYAVEAAATSTPSTPDANLFRTDTTNVRCADEDLFDNPNGGMEEYKLNDDPNTVEIHEEDGEDNLLNMDDWNRKRPQDGDDEDEDNSDVGHNDGDTHEYGIDKNTVSMNANVKGETNNSRKGVFGGWGSNRNGNKSQGGDGNDLLSGDTAASGTNPSWSNASNTSNKGPGGGGWFGGGRRSNSNSSPSNNSPNKSIDTTGISSEDYNTSPRDGIDEAAAAYGEGGLTGDADEDIVDAEIEAEQRMDNRLRPGDHIYIWQTYGINPRAYQRHAVVFSVTKRGEDPMTQQPWDGVTHGSEEEEQLSFDMDTLYTDEEDDVEVTVVSFYHFQRAHQQAHGAAQAAQAASGSRRGKRSGSKREFLYDFIGPDAINKKKPVRKVRYGRKVKKGLLSQKAGVGTALKKDQVGLILARIQYALDFPDHLPDHHALSSNGECASLWCVTGHWCTLQGASILAITSVGQAGGALLAGGILSNLTVLVPMQGVWGMAGWWWYVPATVAYPFLVPMLVALGMASLVPLEILRRNRKKWRGITDGLNHEFWSRASEATKEEYFGVMVTAEKDVELNSFFGVRENDKSAEASRYMPVGGAPGGIDDSDDDDEDEALAMQQMEASCANMADDMNVDLSGKPPSEQSGNRNQKPGAWGSFVGSFRKKNSSSMSGSSRRENENMEKERFQDTSYS